VAVSVIARTVWFVGYSDPIVMSDELFRLLHSFEMRMNRRFDETERRLDAVNVRLDEMNTRLDSVKADPRTMARLVELEANLERLLTGELDPKTLAQLSLTPAETRIVVALFKGQSVEAYAKEAGMKINTARWHVKQIYAKTGVRRQAELSQSI
jgi:DNA-binding CsgD family transcriptional regulator